jgi:hypothetical protein
MSTVQRRYSKKEFARRGDDLYDRKVRPHLGAEDDGKFVALDIDSGEFEIHAKEIIASDRLRKRLPEAQIWMVRVGSRHVHRLS